MSQVSSPAAAALLARLADLAPVVASHAQPAERAARLPAALARPLLDGGFFRMWIPTAVDGLELPLPDTLAVYEAAAALDGSLGWAVMIGNGGGLFAAWLPLDGARELFGPAPALVAGSGSPSGTAERVHGGFRVRGHWRYASGAHHASIFTASCVITENGRPVAGPGGEPLVRAMCIRPADVTILETWDTSGLRGTGSHDFRVDDAFVPAHHVFSVITDPPREPGALYRLPFVVLTQLPVAAVGLGIARHALECFKQLAIDPRPGAHGQPLAQDPAVQLRYAHSVAEFAQVRAGIDFTAARAWDTVVRGGAPDARQLADVAAISTVALMRLRTLVDELAALAGMAAIRQGDFARACRDLTALCAHGSVSPRNLAAAGAILLSAAGADPASAAG